MEQRLTAFRAIVILSYVTYLASVYFYLIPHHQYSAQMIDLASGSGLGGVLRWNDESYWILEIIYLGLSVGVFLLSRRALHLYTVWCIGLLFTTMFTGVTVYLPFEAYFGSLSWILSGAALGMAYGSDLHAKFR